MPFTDNVPEQEIYFYADYHPWWLQRDLVRNPKRNDFTRWVLDFKKGENYTIEAMARILDAKFKDGIVVAYVPSSNSNKTVTSIRKVAETLASVKNRIDGTSCLVRHTTVQKAALGGNRAKQVHYDSIRIEHKELIRGKTVVLLDDVTTTGNSLIACKELLLQAGAGKVVCYALGKTVH